MAAAGKPGDGQNQWYRVVICEGRYREVRRMWEAVGCQVSRLKRIRYGTVRLPRNLKQGEYVKLAPAQQQKLLRRLQDVPAEPSGGEAGKIALSPEGRKREGKSRG